MKGIKYIDTIIVSSSAELEDVASANVIDGECVLTAGVSIPKNLELESKIECTLRFALKLHDGEENLLMMETRNTFEVDEALSLEDVDRSIQAYCINKSSEVLSKRIAEFFRIHIGKAIEIGIPRFDEKDASSLTAEDSI